ncbi:MAG: phosphotransferase [Acidimicrobiia bacterium]|nr:phosphotransferase [Acidimicrobiia bacterium]
MTHLRDLPAIESALSAYLSGAWGRPVRCTDLEETSVGARRGNILFRAIDGETSHDLVVTIYPPADVVIFGVHDETGALRLAEAANAPVPHVFEVCDDPSWFGEPFFISQRVFGESLPRSILRLVAADDSLGERVGAQIGRGFAAIHSVPATDCPETIRRPLDVAPSATALVTLREQMDELLQPAPVFELGLRWLERNQPDPPAAHTMVHGDVRTGNILVSADGLEAILDWEGCHTGDPHEDLGWVCIRTWRFGNDELEVGGFSPRRAMVEAYEEAGGRFDPHAYHWWKVLGTLRWGVGLSRQSVQHIQRTYRNIAMAGSGRRAVELEYDLLRLLGPVL